MDIRPAVNEIHCGQIRGLPLVTMGVHGPYSQEEGAIEDVSKHLGWQCVI